MTKPTTAENQATIQALTAALNDVPVGGTATFAALSEVAGFDIKTRLYLFHRAAKDLNQNNGALFANVRGVGYQRLPPESFASVGTAARAKIRRTSKNAIAAITNAAARANNIDTPAQRKISAELAALGLAAHIAGNGFVHRIAQADPQAPLSVADAGQELLRHLGTTPATATRKDAP